MLQIGIISDTHGYLDERILHHFEPCNEICHAGDIGTMEVALALENHKPLRAVYGNIDNHIIQQAYPENNVFMCEGVKVLITHIAGLPPKYNKRVLPLITTHQPDLLICGHSHILKVLREPTLNLLHLNPGAAGKSGFHKVRTLVRLRIQDKRIFDVEVIELGKK